MTWGKCALAWIFLALVGLSAPLARAGLPPPCDRGWVYFDLGNTIIDTSDWDHLKYMTQAREYVRELKAAGFHLGLITNIPESWGDTHEAKLATLKESIGKSWVETTAFSWSDFEDILLPPSDLDRKPAPFLFAKALSQHPGCRIAYQGDDAAEVAAAMKAGFTSGYVVGKASAEDYFPPADQIFPQP